MLGDFLLSWFECRIQALQVPIQRPFQATYLFVILEIHRRGPIPSAVRQAGAGGAGVTALAPDLPQTVQGVAEDGKLIVLPANIIQ